MWLFTRTGFYTVVENKHDKQTVIIRARVKKDLKEFKKQYMSPEQVMRASITFHKDYDYPYRMIVPKQVFAEAMATAALDVDYEKFKRAVAKESGHRRASLYTKVWGLMIDLELDTTRINNYFNRELPYRK